MQKGFTLIETIIAVGLTLFVLSFALANYYRGGDDSLLEREVSLLMGRLRLAQEQTSAGSTLRYCSGGRQGAICDDNTDCKFGAFQFTCQSPAVPPGGRTILFSCTDTYNYTVHKTTSWPGTGAYYQFAENSACTAKCFPFGYWSTHDDSKVDAFANSEYTDHWKGDTREAVYRFDSRVAIRDLQLVEDTTAQAYRCATGSPWRGQVHPLSISGTIPADYPLQVLLRFEPPEGRVTVVNDNIDNTTPLGNAWKMFEVMVGLKSRSTDCKVVSATREGSISTRNDADCKFTTPN